VTAARFHHLRHLGDVRFGFATTKFLHHVQVIVAKLAFPAVLHELFHHCEVGFAVFTTALIHRSIHDCCPHVLGSKVVFMRRIFVAHNPELPLEAVIWVNENCVCSALRG
jgi:hypothetical protein